LSNGILFNPDKSSSFNNGKSILVRDVQGYCLKLLNLVMYLLEYIYIIVSPPGVGTTAGVSLLSNQKLPLVLSYDHLYKIFDPADKLMSNNI